LQCLQKNVEKYLVVTTDQKVTGLNPVGITKSSPAPAGFFYFEGIPEARFRGDTKNEKMAAEGGCSLSGAHLTDHERSK
jgi:hypothetical protein